MTGTTHDFFLDVYFTDYNGESFRDIQGDLGRLFGFCTYRLQHAREEKFVWDGCQPHHFVHFNHELGGFYLLFCFAGSETRRRRYETAFDTTNLGITTVASSGELDSQSRETYTTGGEDSLFL